MAVELNVSKMLIKYILDVFSSSTIEIIFQENVNAFKK